MSLQKVKIFVKSIYYRTAFKIVELSFFLCLLIVIVFLTLSTSDSAGPGFCLFHRLTGLYCFSCGTTRALRALLNGNVLSALDFNLFFVFLLPFFFYMFFCYFLWRFTGKNVLWKGFYQPSYYVYTIIILLLFTVLRNLPFAPFTFLAP